MDEILPGESRRVVNGSNPQSRCVRTFQQQGKTKREMNEKLLIACALKKEAMELRKKIGFRHPVEVTGLGPDRTLKNLEALFDHYKPSAIIFTGMAGQLNPDFELGQIVYPEAWCLESGTRFDVNPHLKNFLVEQRIPVRETGITVRKPVVREAARVKLHTQTGASICDMESAAVMMFANSLEIPCIAPKIISDTARSGMLGFYRHFDKNMAKMADKTAELAEIISGLLQKKLL